MERLGHAEVDDLRHRLFLLQRHQHVRRLDVAVQHALLMRVLDGVANGHEQPQPLGDGRPDVVAVPRDGDAALHQLHHEIRQASFGGARVEHRGDARVAHQGQRLAFGLEALEDQLRVHARLDHLERDSPLYGLLLFRNPDRAHAALAELLEQAIRPDADVRRRRRGVVAGHQGLEARKPGVGIPGFGRGGHAVPGRQHNPAPEGGLAGSWMGGAQAFASSENRRPGAV